MMKEAVQEYIDQNPKTPGPRGERGEQGERGPTGFDGSRQPQKIKLEEIGYFDPSADDEGDVMTSGKTIVYKNVYDFNNRVKDIIEQYGRKEIRAVILTTLRGDALKWYSNELTETEKALLRTSTIKDFLDGLVRRFKIRTPIAIVKLRNAVYGYTEIRDGLRPRQHANRIAGLARAAEIPSVYN